MRDWPRRSASSAPSTSARVERRVAERALQPAILVDHQGRLRRGPLPRLVRTDFGRRRVGGERRDDGGTVAARTERRRGRLDGRGGHRGLHQHVDRAAAGEPDVPRLLVADPVADDAGVAGRTGMLDLFRGRALDTAAAHRPRDATVRGVQQRRTLRPRGGAERTNDDGAARVDTFALPAG